MPPCVFVFVPAATPPVTSALLDWYEGEGGVLVGCDTEGFGANFGEFLLNVDLNGRSGNGNVSYWPGSGVPAEYCLAPLCSYIFTCRSQRILASAVSFLSELIPELMYVDDRDVGLLGSAVSEQGVHFDGFGV